MTEPAAKRAAPTIPILFFAAIDLLVAVFLLVDGGFTVQFWLITAIGLSLAGLGLSHVWRNTAE